MKQTTMQEAADAGQKNDLEAMWNVVDHWTKPGTPIPCEQALAVLDDLKDVRDQCLAIFRDDTQPMEIRMKAADIGLAVIDFNLSLATGRRELNLVTTPGAAGRRNDKTIKS